MAITSTPAAKSASMRGSRSMIPTAAPTRSLPSESLQALGYRRIFSMSLMVIRPFKRFSSSTTSSFSMRCLWSSFLDSSRVMLDLTVMRFFLVITWDTGCSRFSSKRRSRLVRMPTSFSFLTTGTPEMEYWCIRASASLTFRSGSMVIGSTTMPLSDFFTRSTSMAWRSMLMLR